MSGRLVLERRILAAAALGRMRTARRKNAASDFIAQRRHHARNFRESLAPDAAYVILETDQAACAYTDDALNSAATGASSTLRPAYMTTTRCAISATTPKSCVISTIAAPVFL
jgi:hypothetical protein